MSRVVKPLNVSPFIKGARWTFLVLGFYFGIAKRARIVAIEEIERPKRLAALEEEKKQRYLEGKLNGIKDLKGLFKEMEVEPDPGWENSV